MVIKEFVGKHIDMEIAGEWCDDGYSGITFERPGIKDLLANVFSGNIECIIVKDLSRFGRDYIETGRYIRYIFPQLGIRCIGYLAECRPGEVLTIQASGLGDSRFVRGIDAQGKPRFETALYFGETPV